MKKPELSNFNLTQEMIDLYQSQHESFRKNLDERLQSKKKLYIGIFIVSIIITILSAIIIFANGFDKDIFGYVVGSFVVFDIVWGCICFKDNDEWSLSSSECERIKSETIDQDLEKKVLNYEKALKIYDKSITIRELSLVKAELLCPKIDIRNGSINGYHSIGMRWMVFSNKYLANPENYPELRVTMENQDYFDELYLSTIEKQKKTPPRLKCDIPVSTSNQLEFYYPCSIVFSAMENKKPGDIVTTCLGVNYRILEVINFDN